MQGMRHQPFAYVGAIQAKGKFLQAWRRMTLSHDAHLQRFNFTLSRHPR